MLGSESSEIHVHIVMSNAVSNPTIQPIQFILIQIWTVMCYKQDKGFELSKIWGFHYGDYEECCPLGCYAMWLL
jgi:hypothetical protein